MTQTIKAQRAPRTVRIDCKLNVCAHYTHTWRHKVLKRELYGQFAVFTLMHTVNKERERTIHSVCVYVYGRVPFFFIYLQMEFV